MIRSYISIAIRQLIRGKGYSVLNILSLSLGMAAFLVIYIWTSHQKSMDGFHENKDHLYSLYFSAKGSEDAQSGYKIPLNYKSPSWNIKENFADQLKESIPGIAKATDYHSLYALPWGYPRTFQVGEEKQKLAGTVVENDFLSMFSINLLSGQKIDALNSARNILISAKMSNLFFPDAETAIGKTIRYENKMDLVVAGVFEDLPNNSSLQFDYLLSWNLFEQNQIYRSTNHWQTFIMLDENANPDAVNTEIQDFLHARLTALPDIEVSLGLIPFHQTNLYTEFENGRPSGGKVEYLQLFLFVGLLILTLACINFAGISTARSVKRSKEVGVRKAIGSTKFHLIGQFLTETLLLSGIAMTISLTVASVVLPLLNSMLELSIEFPYQDFTFWILALCLAVGTGLLAGIYPAFVLASQRAFVIIRRDFRLSPTNVLFQKGLVVFQSFLSLTMIIGALIVYQQTHYIQEGDLGYNRENVVYLPVEGELITKYGLFKTELEKMPGISGVDRSSEAPHSMNFEVVDAINWQGKEPNQKIGFYPTSVGYDYVEMMGLRVAEGRNFSRAIQTDSSAFLINKRAVQEMGIEDPIGKWISAWNKKGKIIGILEDYHINSLHQPIKPVIMDVKEDLNFGNILVKTAPSQTTMAIESITEIFSQINPAYALDLKFLDSEYQKMYKNEVAISKLSSVFTFISILISCFGIIGLSMTSAEKRMKEIGIRKVLGASVKQLVHLFSAPFIILVLIAAVIAIPVSWVIFSEWLSNFAYHIDLAWYNFAIASGFLLALTFLSISTQAIRAATINPVETIKSE